MEQKRRRDGALRPFGADGDEVMGGRIGGFALSAKHSAMVLAVAPAAGGKARIWVLRESEQRRGERKRESSEQQDGKKAAHDAGGFSVRR